MQAMRIRRLIRRDFDRVWQSGCDLLLTPVTLSDGHLHSEFVQRDSRTNTAALDYCTQPANMAGQSRDHGPEGVRVGERWVCFS